MSEQLDAVLQQMAELTEQVREANKKPEDKATLDKAELVAEFKEMAKVIAEEQYKAAQEAQPVRRLPGDPIGHAEKETPDLKSNRYYSQLKDIQANGFSRFGSQKVKAIDLVMADGLLTKANYLKPDVAPSSQDLKNAIKALTSTGSGTGDELVPTNMAGQLWDDIFLASKIVASIPNIPMPTNPFDVSLSLGDVTWYKGTENTATTASDPATAKSTLTATELVTEVNWSYTLEEDAIVALMPTIRARLTQSGGEIIDDFALNADATDAATGNINLDDADPDADTYYLSSGQDGIRHLWLVDNTGQGTNAGGDALADADVTATLGLMGKYAVNPNQVMFICDANTYLEGFMGSTFTNVTTVDKFGPGAVVLTGQLAAYRGIPIIVSESAPLTEADGKVSTTAGNNTLGQISVINRTQWYAGFRRNLIIEVDRDIQKRQFIMVASLREAIAARGTRASATHTAGIRNILV